jgi:hypothetical protein
MYLRFVFLLITRAASWLRLARREPGAAFFTADLLDGTQAYVLAVIEHATRRILCRSKIRFGR